MRRIAGVLTALTLVAFAAAADEQSEHLEHLKMMMHAMSEHGSVIAQPEAINPLAAKTIAITARSFSFSPSAFQVNQGDVITLSVTVPNNDATTVGHGLLMDTYVENGIDVGKGQTTSVTFTATTPGTFAWVCTQPSCGTGHSSMFGQMTVVAVAQTAPTISSISPNNGSPAGATAITITGTNFTSSGTTTVSIGGNPATNVTVVSSTSITAATPAHAEGAVDVTVTNPNGENVTAAGGFTYAAPKVNSVSPNTSSTAGGINVTISGSGFQTGATVTIGGVSATNVNVVDVATIHATTPLGPANEQVSQPLDVVVTNPDGFSATLTRGFTYFVPTLTVVSLSPAIGNNGGGTVVTISGTGFTTAVASSVTFGGVPSTNVSVLNAVTLQATAPAHANGAVDVVVTVGGLSVTKTGVFTYETPKPRHRSVKH